MTATVDQLDFTRDVTGIRPIYRKHSAPCPKFRCLDCHNHDPVSTMGYTCLVKGHTPSDPGDKKPCCWAVPKGQARLGE